MVQANGLKFTEAKQLADYIKANTELQVDYNQTKGEITIPLKKKIDALAALAAAEQSGLEWGQHTNPPRQPRRRIHKIS